MTAEFEGEVEKEIIEEIEEEIPEPSADGFGGLENLLDEEIEVNPDAREDLRDWEGVLPREGIESIDLDEMGYIDTARTKIGRSFKNGGLGGLYALGTFGGSLAGHAEAADMALKATGAAGNAFVEGGAIVAATGSFIATAPVVGAAAIRAGDKITKTILPEDSGLEKGHIYPGGDEEKIAELLEEADATEFIELGGTTYEMDADVPWNIRYLGDAEEDVFYNIGWEYDEDENQTYIELDAMVSWDIEEIDIENIDLDNFDMWRFRAIKDSSPSSWDDFRNLVTKEPASKSEVENYFEEAYNVLDNAGYLDKNKPYSTSGRWAGRRRGMEWTTKVQQDSR